MPGYQDILKDAQESPEIIGLILTGSRGKGFENEYSDYELVLIADEDAVSDLKRKYAETDNVDISIYSLKEFRSYAAWGSPEAWDRYDFAHVKVLVDKTDELPAIIAEKGHLPADKQKEIVHAFIDGYINGVFRSVKCIRNKNAFGAHLEAANSMMDLLSAVFGLHGRHRPFLGYVQKELEKYPLEHFQWEVPEFLEKIERVLKTADLKTQQELLIGVEKMSRALGHNEVFDAWEGKDKWAMTYVEGSGEGDVMPN